MFARGTITSLWLGLAVGLVSLNTLCAQTTQPAAAPAATEPAAAAVAPLAPGAGAAPAAADEVPNARYSFIGIVNGSAVAVRCGPSESYYPTLRLNKGDHVVAVGYKFDWLKIVPPKGSFSYVATMYVHREPGSSSASVTGTNVRVYAGSSLNQVKSQKQLELNAGDKVTILGEAEEFYKIAPPEGAYLYVSKRFVDPVRQATAHELETPVAPAGAHETGSAAGASAAGEIRPLDHTAAGAAEPAAGAGMGAGAAASAPQGEATELVPATPSAEAPAPAPAATGKASEELARLNIDFEAVQKQPIGERSLGELRQLSFANPTKPWPPARMRPWASAAPPSTAPQWCVPSRISRTNCWPRGRMPPRSTPSRPTMKISAARSRRG
jgi:hypothetical protein